MRPIDGLIPAHAGKTVAASAGEVDYWAHPRSRGENWELKKTRLFQGAHPRSRGENVSSSEGLAIQSGSSPLTRGKPHHPPRPANPCGLIPAHAGKTTLNRTGFRSSGAHPRSRGENYTLNCLERLTMGSSPLTRGKRSGLRARALRRRLIPAHAGKTAPSTH